MLSVECILLSVVVYLIHNMERFNFETLNAYKYGRALVKSVYLLIRKLPREEQYALGDQLRRAVVSVPSNVAEGMSRFSPKEQIHFVEIAYGSLMEVLCQLSLANDLGYISDEELQAERVRISDTAKILSGLRTSIQKKITPDH